MVKKKEKEFDPANAKAVLVLLGLLILIWGIVVDSWVKAIGGVLLMAMYSQGLDKK